LEPLLLPLMTQPKLQYLNIKYQSDNYPIKDVENMSLTEVSRWFAFCNFVKFSSMMCKKKGIKFSDMNWNYLDVLRYIDDTSGDIKTMVRDHGGIPRKYSLSIDDDESTNTEEIHYS